MSDLPLLLAEGQTTPSLIATLPFVAILLAIAILPLLHRTHEWWESNRNKLIVSLILAAVTLAYYGLRSYGLAVHREGGEHETAEVEHDPDGQAQQHPPQDVRQSGDQEPADRHADVAPDDPSHATQPAATQPVATHPRTEPGIPTVLAVIRHAVIDEYVPFLTLLFALYVVAGGIVVRGDIPATPLTNTIIIGFGGLLASFIGTTGAAMVLIRFLLRTNAERRHVVHTVVFFIFIVANIGGSLLPIGDPPLFLGYLRGVPFFWTFSLWREWLFMLAIVLAVYYVWDTIAWRRERPADLRRDRLEIRPLRVAGLLNILWIAGVVAAVATLDPAKPIPGTNIEPPPFLREAIQLGFAGMSLWLTPRLLRKENGFNYFAILEVAALFIGIFVTMQVPLEILNAAGPHMREAGFTSPWQFFWATGVLSSFLDNAPTYVVFFQTAESIGATGGGTVRLLDGGVISEPLLVAISCGAVFMGANSYIGNGPNFMVKSIAEQSGVRMPSFFGYMMYSGLVLLPVFVLLTLVFFR